MQRPSPSAQTRECAPPQVPEGALAVREAAARLGITSGGLVRLADEQRERLPALRSLRSGQVLGIAADNLHLWVEFLAAGDRDKRDRDWQEARRAALAAPRGTSPAWQESAERVEEQLS